MAAQNGGKVDEVAAQLWHAWVSLSVIGHRTCLGEYLLQHFVDSSKGKLKRKYIVNTCVIFMYELVCVCVCVHASMCIFTVIAILWYDATIMP